MDWLLHQLCTFAIVQDAEAKTEQNFVSDDLEIRKLHDQVAQLCCKLLSNKNIAQDHQDQFMISETKQTIYILGGKEKVLEKLDVAERQVVGQLHQLDSNPNAADELHKMLSEVADTIPDRNLAQVMGKLVTKNSISETFALLYKVRLYDTFMTFQPSNAQKML